jgi:ketosteroid isomerase-like protein
MSQANVEAARAQYKRWNAGDMEAWIAGFDPNVEYVSSVMAGLDGTGEFYGHAGLHRFVAQYRDAWEDFQLEPSEFIAADDRVIVVMRAFERGRESGVAVEHEVAHVWTFRNGLAVRHESYQSRAQALDAAGRQE